MTEPTAHPGLRRILAASEGVELFDVLGERLASSDLSTLLLGVFDHRAGAVRPTDLLRRYGSDRFVAPAQVDARALARIELAALDAVASDFTPVALAPLVPFGTHLAMGATPQNNVVTTVRGTEVAADPTNSLALEAAVRRAAMLDADSRSQEVVDLAAVSRVTRAQHFDGPRSFAHFSLLGLVSAGRDRGDFAFEKDALQRLIGALVRTVRSVTPEGIEVHLSAFTPAADAMCEQLAELLTSPTTHCVLDPDRDHGREYYRNVCFKLHVAIGSETVEVGDGGDVWWMRDLLQSNKERLVIGGLGLERLAMVLGQADQALT